MKSAEIDKSIKTKKVYLSSGEKLEYWGNAFILLFIIGMVLILEIRAELDNRRFPWALILLASLATLLIISKISSMKFEVWKVKLSEIQFSEAFLSTSIHLDWHLLINRSNYFIATKAIGWQWEGLRITAIRTENEIYFNSMIAPSIRSNPFSFGWNRKNKDGFRKNVLKIIEGDNVVLEAEKDRKKQDERFWKESEWTFTNSLKRIIGYGLAIPLIILGVWFIASGELKGIFLGLVFILLCVSYIYYDIQILRLKGKKR